MRIGIYNICKDEIKHIDQWFEPLKTADVICILDTGSTDGSYEKWQELAQQYPNLHIQQKIYNPFYFDDARNDALDFIKTFLTEEDVVFHLDLDETAQSNFIQEARKQCNNNAEIFLVNDAAGGVTWKGHKLLPYLRWIYHIHEKIVDIRNNSNKDITHYTLQKTYYTHKQDLTKKRNYRDRLHSLVNEFPHCIHYLVYSLGEEQQKVPQDIDFCNYLRLQILQEGTTNFTDEHYLDIEWLCYATINLPNQYDDYCIQILEDILKTKGDYNSKCLYYTMGLKYQRLSQIDKAEYAFLHSLMTVTNGTWLDYGFSDEQLLKDMIMFYFYNKKDYISASFYADRCYELFHTGINLYNMEICADAIPTEDKQSWVLLLTDNGYINGVVATIYTLRAVDTQKPITIIVNNDIDIENIKTLLYLNVRILVFEKIAIQNREEVTAWWYSLDKPGYHCALTKLNIFNLTQFDKIVYLDSDTWVMKNIDDLFTYPSLSAVPDVHGLSDKLCSGLLVIEPNNEIFKDIMKLFQTDYIQQQEMIHDQFILQEFFKLNYNKLPVHYHLWATYYEDGNAWSNPTNEPDKYEEYFFHLKEVKAYHLIDVKPWTVSKQYYRDLTNRFWVYSSILLRYIDLINYCIITLKKAGINNKYLKYIE